MKKLRLDLDSMQVESFEISAGGERGGTVRGNDSGADCTWDYTNTCPGTTSPGYGCLTLPADDCPPFTA